MLKNILEWYKLMKETISVLKTELKKFAANKSAYAAAAMAVILLVGFFGLLLPQFSEFYMSNYSGVYNRVIDDSERSLIMSEYIKKRDYLELSKALSEGKDVDIPDGVVFPPFDEKELKELEFYIETDTISYDYIETTDLFNNNKSDLASVQMMFSADMSFYAFMLLCVVIIMYAFWGDSRGAIKNYCASGIKRKNIFLGKYVFVQIPIVAVFIGIIIIGLVLGSGNAGGAALMYLYGNLHAVSMFSLFVGRMVGAFIFTQIFLLAIVSISNFSKNIFFAVTAVTLSVILLTFITVYIFGFPIYASLGMYFLPFAGLQYISAPLWSAGYLGYLLVYSAIVAGMVVLGVYSQKRDVAGER